MKQEVQAIFTKMNLIRLVFSLKWHIFRQILKILKKKRTASDKVLKDKVFNSDKNPKYGGYQRGLSSMVYQFFDKKSKGSGVNIPLQFNEQLAEELHNPIIRNLKKRKVYSGFRDNICGADLADMQLISNFNKIFRFLLCVIDIFSKYA